MFGLIRELFAAGGWVAYPLLGLSILALAMVIERSIYWLRSGNSAVQMRTIERAFARGGATEARAVAADMPGPLAGFVAGTSDSEGSILASAEAVRPEIERFLPMLSAVVTAAPMLGILGTVTGIIDSFQLLGGDGPVTDPTLVAQGIAQALYTTAAGLVIALLVLFPLVVLKARAERCLSSIEAAGAIIAPGRASESSDSAAASG